MQHPSRRSTPILLLIALMLALALWRVVDPGFPASLAPVAPPAAVSAERPLDGPGGTPTRPPTRTPAPTATHTSTPLPPTPVPPTPTPTTVPPTPAPPTPTPTAVPPTAVPPTAASTATPPPPALPTLAPTPAPPTPAPTQLPPASEVYIVRAGDTLTRIAARFRTSITMLMNWNGLGSPNMIYPGQRLRVSAAPLRYGPTAHLIPDSEVVYGPASVGFDVEAFARSRPGLLKGYAELVENRIVLSGPQIVQLVAQRFSVGPRLLLALLEYRGGWLSNPNPSEEARTYPLGKVDEQYKGLLEQLSWAANRVNMGYYGWKQRGLRTVEFKDGSQALLADGLNAGTAGLQYMLALESDYQTWLNAAGPDGMIQTYRALFGDPFQYTTAIVPAGLTAPPMELPWAAGETWYFTGGAHGGWGSGSAYAAVDFVGDPKPTDCAVSPMWVRAAAPGLVIRSDYGEVLVDLGKQPDGLEQTGWVVLYMHIADQDRVAAGTHLKTGDPIGHPSCTGGFATGAHVHFARRYNGEWIPVAGGPAPLVLSGWTFQVAGEYQGTMSKDGVVLHPCSCRIGNLVTK